MKKILSFVFSMFLGFSGFSQEKIEKKEDQKSKKTICKKEVYICNSTASKTYHLTKKCGALKKCKDSIRPICKAKVEKKFGRLLCSFEKN
ncbi:hypothetical protein [Aquimarina sp. MMG016]|uniref:hypothetical protein n=1 Tax=Aquimarina sp. MMG016 TaxID=2822690 RepID=UPI001B3A37FE|nr:hypothetical protein [Aquimarina sp. MMG016]MBQ4819620.1 hypothetical protein [Aquimarina sp. MMG016]